MNLVQAYARTADRYLAAADGALASSLQEVSIFTAYHSFECIGGALAESRGNRYPRAHQRKMNQFTHSAKGFKFALAVAHLAIALSSFRSLSLYPAPGLPPNHCSPDCNLTMADALSLCRRVKGIVGAVKRVI